LKIRRQPIPEEQRQKEHSYNMMEAAYLDPREEFYEEIVSPIDELEEVQIGKEEHQTTKLGVNMQPEERMEIFVILKKNVDLFAWHLKDMPGIDESIITHKLAISPKAKPVAQCKRKQGEERRLAVGEEVAKLKKAQFIEEIKYPEWLANVVMVKKSSGKWRML
jgi:hypothetical protein